VQPLRKTVFVHIGAPAAGATFLQRQLEENRAALLDAGIAVVDSLRTDLGRGPIVDCRAVVYSNPRLAGAPGRRATRLLGMLAEHHVKVIYGMPNLGDALVTEWQRHVVATDREVSLAAWIKEVASGEHPSFWRTYDLANVGARWAVPPGDIHVVVAPSGSARAGELWTRFASVIGAPKTVGGVNSRADEALAPEELELLRRVRARMTERRAAPGAHELVKETLTGEVQVVRDPVRWTRLPEEHRAWIESQAAEQRARLQSGGFEVVGELADLDPDEQRFDAAESLPSEQRMLASGLEVSALLVERLIRCREQTASRPRRDAPGRGGPTGIRGALQRARGLVSDVSAAAPSIVRRRGRSAPVRSGRRTYYLHVGAPKCGSSYLQALLWKNRQALMRDGVYVPGRSQADHFRAATDFRGQQYVTQAPDDPWRGAWDRLIDDADRAGCPKVVISSEFLADSRAERISARLERLGDADIHVIYATRELGGLLAAVWQQVVQVGPAAPWDDWLGSLARRSGTDWTWDRHDIGKVCARWGANGADELDVLLLPRSGSAPDELWRRFQSIVGWSVRTRVGTNRANESLGYSQAELLRRLQHRLADVEPRHQRARVTKNVVANQVLRRMERVDAPLIPEDRRAWLELESARRRDQLVASGARVVGEADDLVALGSRLAPSLQGPRESVMVDAAVNVIERLAVMIWREEAASAAPTRRSAGPTPR
jgi:hypothetical protein